MPWPKGKKRSPETIAKIRAALMSRARSGSKHYLWGKNLPPETIEKIRATKIGPLNPMWKGNEATEDAIRGRLIRKMPIPKGSDRHHIDGNGRNSETSNILVLTRKEHMIKDGRMEALIKRNKEGLVRGPDNYMWKGNEASYSAKRYRDIRRRKRAGEIILPGFTGKNHSEETKKKMSEARKRYWERKKDTAPM